jgi:PhnB protein
VFAHGQLVYLQIPATDVTMAARFYERVLGWRIDPPDSGFEAPALIGQWITDRPPAPESGPVMWIHVDDVAQTLAEALTAGATPRQGPTPDGPRTLASFSDPAGNLVGIASHGPASTVTVAEAGDPGVHRGDNRTMPPCAIIPELVYDDVTQASRPGLHAHTAGPRISVMLIVPDGDAAVRWYYDALGAEVIWDLGGVAGLEVGGAPFFLHESNPDNPAEDSPDRVGQTSVRIEVFVGDPEGFIERAVAAGAQLGSPVTAHELPWGTHRQGGFVDPFGHKWSVGDTSPLHAGSS